MENINLLYQSLENKKNFDYFSSSDFDDFENEEDTLACKFEQIAFFTISAIKDRKGSEWEEQFVEYITKRINDTSNEYLIARYAHILFIFTRKLQWSNLAIQSYKTIIVELCKDEINAFACYKATDLSLDFYSMQRKTIESEIVPLIKEYIISGNLRLKMWMVLLARKYKLFKGKNSAFIPSICIEMARLSEDYYVCKNFIESGIYFASKDAKVFNYLLRNFYELQGDNEYKNICAIDKDNTNIAIPLQNQHVYKTMIECYKRANATEKYEKAIALYTENKKNIIIPSFTIRVDRDEKLDNMINDHLSEIINKKTNELILYLVIGNHAFFPNREILDRMIANKEYFYQSCLNPVKIDINLNAHPTTDINAFNRKMAMYIAMHKYVDFVISIILNAVHLKKITFANVKRNFERYTTFGGKISSMRNGYSIEYTWFQQIDYILKDFFKQMNLMLKNGNADWRLVIDNLPSKFEGILRDIILLSGGVVTQESKGEMTQVLLDGLLNKTELNKTFNKNDIDFFKYVFTNQGLNIRNDVAHGFYKPIDYTFDKAILCFMCIIRLAKFRLT